MDKAKKVKIVKGASNAIKFGVSMGGGMCASHVVTEIVKNLMPMPPQAKLPFKVATMIGTSMLSAALADVAAEKACDNIDAVADYVIGVMVGADDILASTTDTDAEEYERIINSMVWEVRDAGDIQPEHAEEREALCVE